MSLNRLEAGADLNDPQARGLLHETLELMSNELRRSREELTAVRESDRRVAPVQVEAYPLVMGPVSSGSDLEAGFLIYRTANNIPPNYVEANGQAISRTAHAALFLLYGTAYGAGDGSTTFNVPNLSRRYILGSGGASANGINNTVGSTGGSETSAALIAHTHTGPSHTHDMANHTHTMASHTHDMGNHTHQTTFYEAGGGAANKQPAFTANGQNPANVATGGPSTNTSGAANPSATDGPSAVNTGAGGTGATGSAGSGTSFPILPPTMVLLPLIRSTSTPIDTIQTAPLAWGPVPGQCDMGLRDGFRNAAFTSTFAEVEVGSPPEPVVVASSTGGGTSTVTYKGLTRIPYNFRGFKTRGIRLRSKVVVTGAPALSTVTVTLKIIDPITGVGYLPTTYSRVVSVSAGTIADADFVYAKMTKDDLGADWRPGYALQFELSFELSTSVAVATAVLAVGALHIDW